MISVILANYNGSKYLSESIKSVLAQDFDDFEFIIVDDGSTDNSREIIENYSQHNSKCITTLFFDDNRGQGAAFNIGIQHAKGDIVAFIDSDDIWFPEKLAGVQKNMDQHPEAVLFQHNLSILRNNEITVERFRDILTVGDYFAYTRRKQVIPQFIPTAGLAFRRSALEKVLPIPMQFRTCADGFLTRTTFCYGEVFSVNNLWGAYRVHGANNTYDNPDFSTKAYISDLLLPALNEFYESHNIDFQFHNRLYQLKKTVKQLDLPRNTRILMLRSANKNIMQDILELLITEYPDLTIDLLLPPSANEDFTHERINMLYIKEGFFNADTVSKETIDHIQSLEYSLGLVPYSVNNPDTYQNVHNVLHSLHHCPFFAIDYDGYSYQL